MLMIAYWISMLHCKNYKKSFSSPNIRIGYKHIFHGCAISGNFLKEY